VEFLRRLSAGEPLDGLGGLVRRSGGRVVEDNAPLCVEDLDSLPPARPWRWLDLKPYARYGSALQVQTKRGCELGCTYCTYNRIEGRAWRLRSPARVADEIAEAVRESGLRTVEFTDSTFNIPLDHCKAVLREVAARGLPVRFRTMGLNPGAVDGELADLLVACGFRDVDLGAEAGSNRALRSLGKNFRKASVLRAGGLLRQRGIPVMWYLLAGAPAETAETLRETFETMCRAAAPWDMVNVGVGLRVYNGAPVAERLRQAGAPEADDGFLRPVALAPEGLALEDVKLLVKREALRRTNWFMYDEDERTPAFAMLLGTAVLRALSPQTPIWRLFIAIRRIQELCGLGWLRRRRFERRHGEALRRLELRLASAPRRHTRLEEVRREKAAAAH
jgi:pyruvate-formate lyase-activating enzyme